MSGFATGIGGYGVGSQDSGGSSGSFATITAADLDIYLSGKNGNDASDGLTPATAVATFARAESLIPDVVAHRVIVHVGDAGGAGFYAPLRQQARVLRANIYWYGDGAGQVGEDGFTDLVATTAAIAGSGTTAVVAAVAWVTDAFRGKTVLITSGLASGDRRTIRNNDATTLFPVRPFSAAVAAGDTFRVVEPFQKMALVGGAPLGDPIMCEGCGQQTENTGAFPFQVYFINMIVSNTSATLRWGVKASSVVYFGIEVTGGSFTVSTNTMSSVMAGLDNIDQSLGTVAQGPFNDLGAPLSTSWLGWGMFIGGFAFNTFALPTTGAAQLYLVGNTITSSVSTNPGSSGRMRGGSLNGIATSAVNIASESTFQLQGDNVSLPILLTATAATGTVRCSASGGSVNITGNVDIQNTGTGPLVRADQGVITISGVNSGTAAGSFHSLAVYQAQINYSAITPAFVGTPAGNDLSADGIASEGSPNATLAAAGDAVISQVYGGMVQRI